MIPIECPKCGREGNVPPDRLNAKLTCRGCQAVFHLDNSGRMVMGAPGDPAKGKARANVQYSQPAEAFDLSQAWNSVPKAVKLGVPLALLAALAWPFLGGGTGTPDYEGRAEAVVRALQANDRAKAVSYASAATADATGQWFDLIHAQAQKQSIATDVTAPPGLFSGNPEKDSSIVLMAVLSSTTPSNPPLAINIHLVRDGGTWRLDGAKTLTDAQSYLASLSKKTR